MNFKDQVVIVTGGTRGIGAGITKAFLKEGAHVFATYASNDTAANDFKNQLETFGEKLYLEKFNVSNSEECKNFFARVEEKFENIHVLINNSGVRKDNIIASLAESDWDDVLDINLKGTYLMTQQAILNMMKNRYGRIVNISSIGGQLGLSGQANYAASKAGQIALSKSVSKEVAKRNITINNVCPGFIETELLKDLDPQLVKEYKSQVPMKKFGTVEDVSHAVLFFAHENSRYITGTSLDVSGGL